jgi:methionyl-tRNA formyltransferase
MGTPDFAVPALAAILAAGHDVVAVYTQPPRPKGRGHKIQNSPVHDFAAARGLPVFHPKSLKNPEARLEFAALALDVAVVAAYGLLLPKDVLAAPRFGCLNIHASLLPRWRGASPIQQAIWAGDAQSGVTIMQMDEGLDTGPIIDMKAIDLSPETTTPMLHDALSALGAQRIVENLAKLQQMQQTLPSTPQPAQGVTHAPLLTKEHGRIDWTQNAAAIDRQIRALNPWPGVWTSCEGQKFKIKNAAVLDKVTDENPGKILSKNGEISCGERSSLIIHQIQPDGKSPMDFAAVLNGGYLKVGADFL